MAQEVLIQAIVAADGVSVANITVNLVGDYNAPLAGKTVSLTAYVSSSASSQIETRAQRNSISALSGVTITPALGVTDSNGSCTFAVSSTGVGVLAFYANDLSDNTLITDSATVSFTYGPISIAQSLISISSSTVASGNSDTLTLTAYDASGNAITEGGSTVVFSLSGGTSNGIMSATTDLGNGTYQAVFTGSVGGTAATVNATINSQSVTSTLPTITVTQGTAAKLAFSASPGTSTAGISFGTVPVVLVQDSSGNTVTSANSLVTLAIGTNPGSGTLSGVIAVTASSGVATFTGLSLNQVGSYTLIASTPTLVGATSSAFNLIAGLSSKLVFSTQPVGTSTDSILSTQPIVWVEDSSGNIIVSSNSSVTLGIGTGLGTLSGGVVATASSGIASFSGLFLNQAGSYTLTATSSTLTVATSSVLNIAPGAASKLVFSTQPGGTSAGSNLAPQPVVLVEDANGNVVSNSSAMVTLAVGAGPGTLTGVS